MIVKNKLILYKNSVKYVILDNINEPQIAIILKLNPTSKF